MGPPTFSPSHRKLHIVRYWNLRFEIHCISKYLQGHYNTTYHLSCALFCSLRRLYIVPGTFQLDTSNESYCNKNCWGQPSSQNQLIVTAVYMYTCSFHVSRKLDTNKEPSSNTHFHMGLYCSFCKKYGIIFTRPIF